VSTAGKEGKFTQEGGGGREYKDHVEMQKKLLNFIETCFNGREMLTMSDFTKIIEDVSSEMLISIITLI